MPIDGSSLGGGAFDEIIAIYYPTHQAFLNMRSLPSSDENYRLRDLAAANAQLLRSRGKGRPSYNIPPLAALERAKLW